MSRTYQIFHESGAFLVRRDLGLQITEIVRDLTGTKVVWQLTRRLQQRHDSGFLKDTTNDELEGDDRSALFHQRLPFMMYGYIM